MKRRMAPPTRLTWPEDEGLLSFSEQAASAEIFESHQKPFVGSKQNSRQNKKNDKRSIPGTLAKAESSMWTEKHAPRIATDLCVQPKKIQEVREWMIQSYHSIHNESAYGVCSKLLVLTGGPGVGKSTMCRVLAKELGINIVQWNETQNATITTYTQQQHRHTHTQSQLSSFSDFLYSASSFQTLKLSSSENITEKTLLLIEEIPNIHHEENEMRLRSMMTEYLSRALYPAVFIFSDGAEGQVNATSLEKIIDPIVLYSQKVKIIQVNPATKAKMKKACERIAKREDTKLPDIFLEKIDRANNGDMRSASLALQFTLIGTKRRKTKEKYGGLTRDTRLSPFHALGRLLYAKRENIHSKSSMILKRSIYRSPLSFDPEEALDNSDMSIENCIEFLGFHAPSFFTDEMELSNAFSWFSDAATLLDRKFETGNIQSDTIFPHEYAKSLSSRAVAYSNRNPAPNTFRSFCAPKTFEIRRTKSDNVVKIQKLWSQLSQNRRRSFSSTHCCFSSSEFLSDISYLSIILPNGKFIIYTQ